MTDATIHQLLEELKTVTREWCARNCVFFGAENHSVDCLRRQQLIKMAEREIE